MALVTLNAFDLILTSQGLNLGTLFEKPMMKLEGEKFGCKGHFVYCNRGISLLVALFAGSPDHEFIGTLPEDVSTGCQ
ncbi:hypothetical protein VitviT2T_015929 [Vitis vinifera]|uniref:NAF domain-containing protein n=2 Tax=Vitis vinifera TaxID=29760 RepID=A0ABY9CQG2_VITVI|nr:hypothetical protein CK203_065489 [Vitis vinifera]WJZ97319.1 hypothetical protein VitviT2T_015929 [Vitis vinifera]